jgi:hypothetical protein
MIQYEAVNITSKTSKLMAAGLTVAGLTLAPAEVAQASNKSSAAQIEAAKVEKLARNTKEVQKLGNTALAEFEGTIEKGPVNVYIYTGVCAVIGAWTPKGKDNKQMVIIPNPGIIDIYDRKADAVVSESVAWDPYANGFVTGQLNVSAVNGQTTAKRVRGMNNQDDKFFPNKSIKTESVQFSVAHNSVVTNVGSGNQERVMTGVAGGVAPSPAVYLSQGVIQAVCVSGVENSVLFPQPVST